MKRETLFFWVGLLILCGCRQADNAPVPQMQKLVTVPATAVDSVAVATAAETSHSGKVWICKSAGSKKYHYNRDCGGLGRCKHAIEPMTVEQAEAVGLTQCRYKKCH